MNKRNLKAVTLVELLIVVMIISAFTFIAVPRMGIAAILKGKSQTAANTIASAIRLCRTLAIDNAADNQQGFSLNMTGSGSYSGFQIVNLKTSTVVKTETIQKNVTCTGANDFQFGPLGSRLGDSDSLTVSAGGKSYVISVITATGMVRCEQQ